MSDMPAHVPAARRGELAAVAIEDLFKLIGSYREPAHTILRHLTHVYWNMRYIGMYPSAIKRIEEAKSVGVEWDDFREQLFRRFKREDATDGGMRLITFHACLDMLPDHLIDGEGRVVWIQDRPHHTFEAKRRDPEALAEQKAADAADQSSDPLESP